MEVEIRSKDIQTVSVESLIPHEKNMNKHSDAQIERLCKLIEYQGFRNPLIVQKGTNYVVAGHGRLEAAKKLGIDKLPVTYQEFESEAQLYAFMVSDNAIAKDSWASLDESMIIDNKELLDGLDNLDLLGIEDFELPEVKVLDDANEDTIPENVETRCKSGDLWILGEHRLLCGDSTNIQHVEKLMNGHKADMVFTDPPYGMSAVSKSGVLSANYKGDILGDDNTDVARDTFKLLISMFAKASHVWWGSNYYCSHLPDAECWIVWDKNNGESDQTDCELAWTNFRSTVRQFTQASEKTNRVHPTQKPVSLFEWTLERFKQDPNIVLDAFGGSGSTLIACEKTNRKCYMMELDEHYCSVILKRWEDYTNQKARLESQTKATENEL